MQVPYNHTFKKQTQKLIPADKKKAVISSVNIQQRQVNLFFIDNPTNIIKGVPVSANVNLSASSVGLTCKVDIFDETNQKDMIVAYLYGTVNAYTGTLTVMTGISIDFVGKTFSATTKTITMVNGIITNVA